MSQDLHYNQAYIFFEDAKYSRALEEMARSETIDDESFKKFAAQCNAMIAQQYIITIKQLISDGDYNEAQRLKREYQDNYQQNEAIDAIDVPSPEPKPSPITTTAYTAPIRKLSNLINRNANKDDSDTSNKMIGLLAGAVGITLLLLIIISTCSSSSSDSDDYDSSSSNSEQTYENNYQESYESEAAEEVEQPTYYDTYESESSYNNDYSSDTYNDNSADVWE